MSANTVTEGTNIPEVKTETSPLKETTSRNLTSPCNVFCNWDEHSGSLKTTVIVLFGATGAITLALLTQVYYGEYQIHSGGTISCDSYECSVIGADVLKKGGNAIDAAVAAAFCLSVVNFHVTGLGGGGYLMVYNHRKQRVLDVIDFRETVPQSYNLTPFNQKFADGFTVGVPGFVQGLWDAHQKHGKLDWQDLVKPSVKLAKNGFTVSDSLMSSASHLKPSAINLNLIKLMRTLREGENKSMPELAATLDLIAAKGAEAFYNGSIAMDIVYSVKLAKGNLSLDDLSQYKTSRSNILRTQIGEFDVIVPGSSSGGALLLSLLDNIEILDLNEQIDTPAEIILKLSDTVHDTYLSFLQKLSSFTEQPDSAATQVSVIDTDENYVTLTAGLNTWLGSQILTGTGILLNDAVVRGGINEERRPVSLASPIIIIQNNEVCGRRFVLGSGDVTIAAQFLTNLLIFNRNLSVSIEAPRFNVDNIPRHLRLEDHVPQFSAETIRPLQQLMKIETIVSPYKSVNVIEKIVDTVYAYADSRGGGLPAQF